MPSSTLRLRVCRGAGGVLYTPGLHARPDTSWRGARGALSDSTSATVYVAIALPPTPSGFALAG
jgi:hypothetical protein